MLVTCISWVSGQTQDQYGTESFFFQFLSCCISLLTAVGSRSGDKVLKACPSGHAASSCWLRAYVRGSGLPGTRLSLLSCLSSGFLPSQWSTAPWSSEQRTPPCATAILFSRLLLPSILLVSCAKSSDNLLLRMLSPSLGNVPAFAPVELSLTFPLLLVLRLGLNSPSHNLGGLRSSAQFAFHQLSVIRST